MLLTRGRYSPGVSTAVLLFYPIGIAVFWRASFDGVSLVTLIGAGLMGAILMAYPVVMLRLKDKPYFRQTP